jgi:hypothetical protein
MQLNVAYTIRAPSFVQPRNGDCVTWGAQIDKQHIDTRTLYTYLDNSHSKSVIC